MKNWSVRIISDDEFLLNGLINFMKDKKPELLSSPMMIIDLDRVCELSKLETYIQQATHSTIIT